MNVSNCCSAASTDQAAAYSGFRRQMQDFRGLAKALRSGDISSAQDAFTTLQNDLHGAPTNKKPSALLDQNTPLGKDFKALEDALKSGDLKAAQDAFAALKKD